MCRTIRNDRGTSLIELVVTLGFATVIMGIAISNLLAMERPLASASRELAGFFKQARAKAVATTSAYTVSAPDSHTIIASFGRTCSDANPTQDMRLYLELPTNINLTDTTWTVCYSARGIADTSPSLTLTGPDYSQTSVQVFLGGAVRVTDN